MIERTFHRVMSRIRLVTTVGALRLVLAVIEALEHLLLHVFERDVREERLEEEVGEAEGEVAVELGVIQCRHHVVNREVKIITTHYVRQERCNEQNMARSVARSKGVTGF